MYISSARPLVTPAKVFGPGRLARQYSVVASCRLVARAAVAGTGAARPGSPQEGPGFASGLGRDGKRDEQVRWGGKFHERKTRTSSTEETCGLAKSDSSNEGSLISGQDLQEEELGVGLG